MARMHSHSCHGPEGDLLKGRTGAKSIWRSGRVFLSLEGVMHFLLRLIFPQRNRLLTGSAPAGGLVPSREKPQ